MYTFAAVIIRTDSHIEAYRQRALRNPAFMSGRSAQLTEAANAYIRSIVGEVPELLDVGCGDGSLLASMSAQRRMGVMPTEDECKVLRHVHPEVWFTRGTVHRIPVTDRAFDTVICNGVLLLLDSEESLMAALAELRRVAKRQLFIGEMPYRPESFNQDISSPYAFVRGNFSKGFREGAWALKHLARAVVGMETFVSEPNHLLHHRDLSELMGLKAARTGERVPGRRDYLFNL